ncbi:CaiB/BaiF CoA transferase family protein [Chloroflexota bacterium]
MTNKTNRKKPQALEGVKVLDFTWMAAGPIGTKYLADYGAEVIKVESTKRIDLMRLTAPYKDGIIEPDHCAPFIPFNTSKLSITVDLGNPQGLAVLRRLIPWADVVSQNFRPGFMKRIGFDYEELKKLNPDIIMVSASIMGQTGPFSDYPGWGHMISALTGQYHMTGWPDRGPTFPCSVTYADSIAAIFLPLAVITALEYRRRTGKGQHLDLSQIEVIGNLMTTAILDYQINKREQSPVGNRCAYAAPHAAFRCLGKDKWCTIAIFSEEEWTAFCKVIGAEWTRDTKFSSFASRKENEDELERLIEQWTVNRSAHDVMIEMQNAGVPAGVVQEAEDIVEHDPQIKFRQFFRKLEHPVMGYMSHPDEPIKLSKTPANISTAPCIGQHNEYVFTTVLGMSDEEYVELLRSEALT